MRKEKISHNRFVILFVIIFMFFLLTGIVAYLMIIAPPMNFSYHVGGVVIREELDSYQQEFIRVSFGIKASAYLITKVEYARASKDTVVIRGRLHLFKDGIGNRVRVDIPLDDNIMYIRLGGRYGEILWSRIDDV